MPVLIVLSMSIIIHYRVLYGKLESGSSTPIRRSSAEGDAIRASSRLIGCPAALGHSSHGYLAQKFHVLHQVFEGDGLAFTQHLCVKFRYTAEALGHLTLMGHHEQ